MKYVVLIPVYNEEKAIQGLVQSLVKKGIDVVVVDDGSTDNSGALAAAAGARVIQHKRRTGKGFALNEGFESILNDNYTGIIMMDGDGQHAVEDIEKFLVQAKNNPQSVINGNRMGNLKDMPWLRQVTNKVMSLLISSVCGVSIPDTQCGFRYIGTEVLRKLKFKTSGFEIESEMLITAARAGIPIYSVEVQTIYADEDSKINPFLDTLKFIRFYLKALFKR